MQQIAVLIEEVCRDRNSVSTTNSSAILLPSSLIAALLDTQVGFHCLFHNDTVKDHGFPDTKRLSLGL